MAGVGEENERMFCMRHCTPDCNIFFLSFPPCCPVCNAELNNCSLIIPPFRVPSTFVSRQSAVCKILLRPTDGNFLRDYRNGDNLHIGINNSKGVVFNYDERGLMMDREGWSQCVAVNVVPNGRHEVFAQDWDKELEASTRTGLWSAARYEHESNNCYDYVLDVLNKLFPKHERFSNKKTFCRVYVIPATTRAAQYITLFREVLEKGFAVKSAQE